jgi:hypothetical protein
MADKKSNVENLKAEAKQENTFEYKGVTYSVPPMNEWDPDAIEALENDKLVTAVHKALGEAQYRVFKAGRPTMDDFSALADKLFDTLEGVSSGE